MGTIWIIGVIVFGMYAGYQYGKADVYTQRELGSVLIACVAFWPFVLALAILVSPFAGMIYLGKRSKLKEK
jgi:hypothetical protein